MPSSGLSELRFVSKHSERHNTLKYACVLRGNKRIVIRELKSLYFMGVKNNIFREKGT